MISFHLPPTAASAAVNGQPLRGFRRRVRRVVTVRFLLKKELEAVLLPMLANYHVVLVEDPDARIRFRQRNGHAGRRPAARTRRHDLPPHR
jgi:hypothetical protein